MALDDPRTKKIIIVDDDQSQLDIVEHMLRKEGFKVLAALSAEDAKPKIETSNPDLVITDLVMPGMSGIELVHHLQAEGLGSIPVIVVTGRDSKTTDTEQMIRMESNVVDFIRKPFHLTVFVMRVHQILKTIPISSSQPPATS